jgi:hypothetical protein
MRLAERIEAAGLAPDVLAALRLALADVAGVRGSASVEYILLGRVFDRLVPADAAPAPFDELWPHADLCLTLALTLAVSDGDYGLEEARAVGSLASRLGYSAAALAAIEDRVFAELQERGRALRGS